MKYCPLLPLQVLQWAWQTSPPMPLLWQKRRLVVPSLQGLQSSLLHWSTSPGRGSTSRAPRASPGCSTNLQSKGHQGLGAKTTCFVFSSFFLYFKYKNEGVKFYIDLLYIYFGKYRQKCIKYSLLVRFLMIWCQILHSYSRQWFLVGQIRVRGSPPIEALFFSF